MFLVMGAAEAESRKGARVTVALGPCNVCEASRDPFDRGPAPSIVRSPVEGRRP
jgi:hypothetical protein